MFTEVKIPSTYIGIVKISTYICRTQSSLGVKSNWHYILYLLSSVASVKISRKVFFIVYLLLGKNANKQIMRENVESCGANYYLRCNAIGCCSQFKPLFMQIVNKAIKMQEILSNPQQKALQNPSSIDISRGRITRHPV